MHWLLVKLYIKRKAKKCNLKCPKRIDEILKKEVQRYADHKKIVFSWLLTRGEKVLCANAFFPGIILVNAEWAAHLVLFQGDADMRIAFRQTIGHEMTHQEGNYFYFLPFTKKDKFVCWVNEIHADFGGIMKAFDGNIEQGLRGMEYKKSKTPKDKDAHTHPSWEKRMSFIRNKVFDANLVREIANMVGCKDEGMIVKVASYFDDVRLCEE